MIEEKKFGPVTQFIMARVVDGKPVYKMACYYVDGLLIDTGPVHVADEIAAIFAPYRIKTIVNTHHHEDHIGNNIIFQQQFGVGPALAHPRAVPRIVDPTTWTARLLFYQHFTWGSPPPSQAEPVPECITTDHYRFLVIHTPGHSDDHICLLEPAEGWLFTGDLFFGEQVQMLRSDEDAAQIIASLRRLLDPGYNIKTIFCASGRVVEDGRRALQAKISYWEELAEKVCRLHREGRTVEEIRDELLGPETPMFMLTEGDFGKIHLIKSLIQNFCF